MAARSSTCAARPSTHSTNCPPPTGPPPTARPLPQVIVAADTHVFLLERGSALSASIEKAARVKRVRSFSRTLSAFAPKATEVHALATHARYLAPPPRSPPHLPPPPRPASLTPRPPCHHLHYHSCYHHSRHIHSHRPRRRPPRHLCSWDASRSDGPASSTTMPPSPPFPTRGVRASPRPRASRGRSVAP
jgi:hypothetical protein